MGRLKGWVSRPQDRLSDAMLMALVLWLCSLVLVAFIVVPLFGLKVGMAVALALLIALLAVCWMVCARPLLKFKRDPRI